MKGAKAIDVNIAGFRQTFDPAIKVLREVTVSALSGRNAGSIFVGWPESANAR